MLKADLVVKNELTDDLTLMVTTADISGPAVLVDSSLVLMSSLLRQRNVLFPNASQATASHIIRWVFAKWNPVDFSFVSAHAMHAHPYDLLSLLRSCYGSPPLAMPAPPRIFGGQLSQFRMSQKIFHPIVRYLLLLGDEDAPALFPPPIFGVTQAENKHDIDSAEAHLIKRMILELFVPKAEELFQMTESWQKRGGENSTPLSADRLQSAMLASFTALLLLPDFFSLKLQAEKEVAKRIAHVVDACLDVSLSSLQSEEFFNLILKLTAPYLPSLATSHLRILVEERKPFLTCIGRISKKLHERDKIEAFNRKSDPMDIDDEFESQSSQTSSISRANILPRRDVWLGHTPEAFYLEATLRVHLINVIRQDEGAMDNLPEEFADQLTQLPMEQFLQCREFMTELFTNYNIIQYESQQLIVERAGDLISEDQFSCCEISLCTCIDLMGCFIMSWTSDTVASSSTLPALGGDLYHYMVKRSLPNNSMSAAAQISLSELLFKVVERKSGYAASLKLPSSRSTLLTILQDGPIEVKFAIGHTLPRLFGLYVLKTHDEIFVDVLEKLPADPRVSEGIAFRLFILAELACKWPTLLRRCIYHIFETPGKIIESAKYATSSLERISRALDLNSPKDLFSLFAPQLLYTWLEGDDIDAIPFSIFGFSSLQDLLVKARTEALAIMMMRGQEQQALDLAKTLGLSPEDMIQQSFTKIMAYSIAHDVSVPSGADQITGESRVRKMLGKELFLENIHLHFADIIATLFDIFDQEDPIEKAFGRDERFVYAAAIMAQIKEYGHLPTALPPNQQPMFKAKYLQREIVHLCSRTPYEPETLWTPSLIVFIARKLLNTIHLALGPLHACSVLRKIRVLVCLAGDRALSSYPLEMLLYTIREFVLDPECADDALGILKYLLIKGQPHLTKVPTFFAGYALSSFSDLRVFLESSQSSTTQESQFKATKSNANLFHDWFRKHLLEYLSPNFKDLDQKRAFQAITKTAANFYSIGTAEKSSDASSLLIEILKDWGRENQLLNDQARSVAFSMLCGKFKSPPSSQRDIIGTDEDAMTHGAAVWKSCRYQGLSEEYLSWAGRVLGRSYAASGEVPQELLRESRLQEYKNLSPGNSGSEEALLNLIQELTSNDDRFTAGLAEAALRTVVTDATVDENPDLMFAFRKSLSESLQSSSDWEPYHSPQSDNFQVEAPSESVLSDTKQLENATWSQQVATLLALSVPQVTTLKILPPILVNVKGFAETAFPFIVHLVLHFQLLTQQTAKRVLSDALKGWLSSAAPAAKENQKLLLNTILYLRTQRVPNETSTADRNHWLEVNFSAASATATRCGMYKVALLFAELAFSETTRSSRRSSAVRDVEDSSQVLLSIFENIDDPDAYYGLEQDASLATVRARLEYENDGTRSLAFRGAEYDTHLRYTSQHSATDAQALVKSLSNLGLAGISNSLLQAQQSLGVSSAHPDATFTIARRLEKWNLPAPANSDSWAVTVYKAYQGMRQAAEPEAVKFSIYSGIADTIRNMTTRNYNTPSLRQHLGALAALTELDDLVNISDSQDLKNILRVLEKRTKWMMSGR